jgi:general secretion pathway protein E
MDQSEPWEAFLERIDHGFAREHLILGVEDEESQCFLIADSTAPSVVHNTGVAMALHPPTLQTDPGELAQLIDLAYKGRSTRTILGESDDQDRHIGTELSNLESDLLTTTGKTDTARFLDNVLFDAIRAGASDVHIHPLETEALVRFRIDGVLSDVRTIPRGACVAVISRLKVLGTMDTAETRSPQDGRATMTLGRFGDGAVAVDMRISTIPTSHGERAVVRLLDTDRGRKLAELDAIGMPEHIRRPYEQIISRSNGMVLLTGPTGSGKTTTLYATLRRIGAGSTSGMNIMTVEDPIEYRLSESNITISQSQVNRKKGMSFASGLRHILRQDPDVVMVGEIRDQETARLAIQAALTGHLVFSTLHTNDSAGAPPRLIDLGCEPYLVSAALTAVMAQRLVRTLHDGCSGEGCDACLNTGFKGRTGIFELFTLDEQSREMISQGSSAIALRRYAIARGMSTLRDDGLRVVAMNATIRTEVERVTVDLSEIPETYNRNHTETSA